MNDRMCKRRELLGRTGRPPLTRPPVCFPWERSQKLTPVFPWEVKRVEPFLVTLVDDLMDRMKVIPAGMRFCTLAVFTMRIACVLRSGECRS